MSTVLLILAISAFALVAWRDRKLAILLVLAFLPSYLIRFSVGPIPFTLLEILVLIIVILWFVRSRPFSYLSILHSPFSIPIFFLLISATLSIFVAPDRLAALGIWRAYFIEPILFFFVVRSTLTSEPDKQRALEALGIGALIVSLFAIVQYLTGYGIPIPWDFERRVTSFFEYPNAVGLYLAPIVTIVLVKMFAKNENLKTKNETKNKLERLKQNKLWVVVAVFGFTAIAIAKTEAALVAIAATLFVLLAWRQISIAHGRKLLVKGAVWTVIGAALLATLLLIPTTREKLLLKDYSGLVRRSQWRETSGMLKDNWLLGAGLSGYPSALEPYHTDTQYEIFQYPHNIILNIWSELGLLGLVAFVWLSILILRNTTAQTSTLRLSDSPTLLNAALLTMIIHGLVDVPYFKNDLAIMTWTFLALLETPILNKL